MKPLLLIIILFFITIPALAEVYNVAEVLDIYDGDTLTLLIIFEPFDIMVRAKVRLDGINCPELRTKDDREKVLGLEAKQFVEDFLAQGNLTIDVRKKEKFGRFLSEIFSDGISLNHALVDAGLARKYGGEKRGPWFPNSY